MQITITRRMAVTAAAVLALVGAGGAIAASGNSKSSSTAAPAGQCRPGGPGERMSTASASAWLRFTFVTRARTRSPGSPRLTKTT